jgi:hypothetical protein
VWNKTRSPSVISLSVIILVTIWLGLSGSSVTADETPDQDQPVGEVVAGTDDIVAEVAKTVPGFAGMFLDGEGNLNLYLQDASRKAEAEAAIASVFGAARFEGAAVRVLEAKYGFLDLYDWRLKMRPVVFGMQGVVSLGIDETRNRISVGLEEMQVEAAVEAELAKLGVPRDAVIFEEAARPIPAGHTLWHRVRPVVGGLKIQADPSGKTCTLGYNALRSTLNVFVTASHCTNVQGGIENTVFYQPTVPAADNRIGLEWADPSPWTGWPCPDGWGCRWSDSAYVKYDGGVWYTRGFIARTIGIGSIRIDHEVPRYRVTGEMTMPTAGETLNKMGQTTGRTEGTVDRTCIDISHTAGIMHLCQDHFTAYAAGGDSGSPVFKITNSPGYQDVSLYGILNSTDPTGSWFSSIYTIQVDLGLLSTCAAGFSC